MSKPFAKPLGNETVKRGIPFCAACSTKTACWKWRSPPPTSMPCRRILSTTSNANPPLGTPRAGTRPEHGKSCALICSSARTSLPRTRTAARGSPTPKTLIASKLACRHARGSRRRPRSFAHRHRFFHWHLAFAEIMQDGGFDVVLGNPPWERIKLQEQEFFASRSQDIATAPNKAARGRLIRQLAREDALPAERALFEAFEAAKRETEAISQFAPYRRALPPDRRRRHQHLRGLCGDISTPGRPEWTGRPHRTDRALPRTIPPRPSSSRQ